MIDVSFGVPRSPGPGDPLDYAGANAIERNLYALGLAWPAFESETLLASIGSYGYLQLDETASPALGLRVTLSQHLPRLLVLLAGPGLESLTWAGEGWTEGNGALVYTMTGPNASNANAALAQLYIGASGDADITVTLAGESLEWEPDELRLHGIGQTKLLFRSKATWGLVRAAKHTWGGAKPLAWGEASALRKDDVT